MAVYQQGVGHISRDYGQLVNIYIIYIVNKADAAALSGIGWLNNPDILFTVMLFKLLIVFVKFAKLIRKNVSVGYEVVVLFAISLLHPHNIETESVFASDFMTLREVIDLLVFVQPFVEIALAA